MTQTSFISLESVEQFQSQGYSESFFLLAYIQVHKHCDLKGRISSGLVLEDASAI